MIELGQNYHFFLYIEIAFLRHLDGSPIKITYHFVLLGFKRSFNVTSSIFKI